MEYNKITDAIFNCVEEHLQDPQDRSSLSMVCRQWLKLEGRARRRVTVSMCYATTPTRLCERFPDLESITVVGKPHGPRQRHLYPIRFTHHQFPDNWGGSVTPWARQFRASLKGLKTVKFKHMAVEDSDIEILAQGHGQKLQVLKLHGCTGFSTDGLSHIAKFCTKLRKLDLKDSVIVEKGGLWLHELGINNKELKTLTLFLTDLHRLDRDDLKFLGSFASLEMTTHDVKELDIRFTDHKRKKLDLRHVDLKENEYWVLFENSPDLEVLYVNTTISDKGLEAVGQFCKKLRKIRIERSSKIKFSDIWMVSEYGLTLLAEGCLELESVHAYLEHVTNETLEVVACLKKLYDFRLIIHDYAFVDWVKPLDKGVWALLRGCTRLEQLAIHYQSLDGALSKLGMQHIGMYGRNVKHLVLGCTFSEVPLGWRLWGTFHS